MNRVSQSLVGAGGVAVVLAMATFAPTAVSAMSLQEAVQQAIDTNPQIEAVKTNREAVEEELRAGRGLYLPQVDVLAGYGSEWESNGTLRDAGHDPRRLNRTEAQLTVSQRLFDGFEADSEVARQKSRVVSGARRVYENSTVLGLDAVGAYLEVQRQRRLVALAEDLVQVHVQILDSIRERAERGAGSQADVAQTEVRLARSQAALANQLGELRNSEASFERIVGILPGNLDMVDVPVSALPTDYNSAIDIAATNNPTVAITDADVETAEHEIDLAESPFYPKVNLEGETSYFDGRDGDPRHEWDAQIMVRVRWNLYRGGIDLAGKREASKRASTAKAQRSLAVIEAREEMAVSWNTYVAEQERVDRLNNAVSSAVTTRDAYADQFRVGERTLLDVLDAENELFTSRAQLTTARSDLVRASYRVLAVGGTLLQTVGASAPPQAEESYRSFGDDVFR